MRITTKASSDSSVAKEVSEDVLFTPIFNNATWRLLLSQACQDIDVEREGLQVIAPFGFEVLEDKIFLAGNLRRFYCYIGAPYHMHLDGDKIVAQYKEALLNRLQSMKTRMFKDIVIIIENQTLYKLKEEGYICKPTDRLIDIQFRHVKTDILTDYANYIIATLGSLHSEKGELKGYRQDRLRLWHLYQIYIIEEKLFGGFISSMNYKQNEIYLSLSKKISNMIQIFYLPKTRYGALDSSEENILNTLILPRLALMRSAVKSRSKQVEKTKVISISYHYGVRLEFSLDSAIYWQIIDKIKNTYLSFI